MWYGSNIDPYWEIARRKENRSKHLTDGLPKVVYYLVAVASMISGVQVVIYKTHLITCLPIYRIQKLCSGYAGTRLKFLLEVTTRYAGVLLSTVKGFVFG